MKIKINPNSAKAITMIALVISIIIIIILTGIALNITFDGSGILSKADKSSNAYIYDNTLEELNSIILTAEAEDIRNEPTLKSVVKYLLNDSENKYIISSYSRADNPENVGDIQTADDVDGKTEVFIIFKGYEFKLDNDLKLNKLDIYYAILDENDGSQTSSISDYVSDGLILHYDGIQNTRSGNNPNATAWEDLTDNHNDGVLNGFNTSTGYYSTEEKGYVLLGHNSYIESTNQLGLTGDAEYTIEIVCKPWSDEKASITGPSDYLNLFDYGTVYNEIGDEGKITHITINRNDGIIKNTLVNMCIEYDGIDSMNDKTTSLTFLKSSGQLSTTNTNAFKVLKNNISFAGTYVVENSYRLGLCYY